jgi:hypothetical protein
VQPLAAKIVEFDLAGQVLRDQLADNLRNLGLEHGLVVHLRHFARFEDFRGPGEVPGTDVMILKIFSPKNLEKKLAFVYRLETKLNFEKIDHNIGI